jgi:hypothetical protein
MEMCVSRKYTFTIQVCLFILCDLIYLAETRTFELQRVSGRWSPIARHTAVSDGQNVYIVGGFDGVQTFHSVCKRHQSF